METLDLVFRPLAIFLTIGVAVFAIFRAPAFNALLGLSVYGLGGVIVAGSVSFAKIAVILQFLTVVVLLVQVLLQNKLPQLMLASFSPRAAYAWLLLLVWIKILLDTRMTGMDMHRETALRLAVFQVFLPTTILLLACAKDGLARTYKMLLFGAVSFALAYLLPVAYPILVEDRIFFALRGFERLTTYGQDTINGGRLLFTGCVGALMAAMTLGLPKSLRTPALAVSAALFLGLVMNGTRQYIISAVLAVALGAGLTGRLRQSLGLLLTIASAAAIVGIGRYFAETQASERLQKSALMLEVGFGRGLIWRDAFATALSSPLTGVGFRNFGNEFASISMETGEVVMQKDNAHGFFQEVFVEHGLVLGLALFAAWLHLLWQAFRSRTTLPSAALIASFFMILALTESFSAGVFNAIGFHFYAAFGLALQAERARHAPKPRVARKPAPVLPQGKLA